MTANRNAYRAATRRMGSGSRGVGGFTLIEVMIVVLIIGILAGLAYMSYDFAVVKTKRSAAAGCALEAAQFMERFRTTRQSYEGGDDAWPGCSAATTDYAVAIIDVEDAVFTVTATPENRQADKDTDCGVMSVNQLGVRTVDGDEVDNPDACW